MNKIKNLESLLSSDDINKSIMEIDDFISGIELNKMTGPQKVFYYNQELEREVNNGGFNQYFLNSSGDYAHQTIQSLQLINANTTADILQKAIDQFPNKNVPQNRDERIALVEQIEGTANEVWDELDKLFFKYQDDLNSLNIVYVKQNKDSF